MKTPNDGRGTILHAALAMVLLTAAASIPAGAADGIAGASLAVETQDQAPPPRRAPATQSSNPSARRGLTVKLLEPVDGAIVTGPTRLAADVGINDAGKLLEVAFFVDDEKIFVDREAPFQTVHDFGSQPKSVVVRVVATHVSGFSVEQSIVTRALRLAYSVEVRRVSLTVSVVDDDGRPVLGLGRENFYLLEDGVRQEILELEVEERPLRIGLVVDTSGSMRDALPQVQLAASEFLGVLRPEDRALVIDFDDQVFLLQDLTDRQADLRAALVSTFARGGTAMYDAVHAGLRRLAGQKDRKALVLLSDGGDSHSVLEKDRVVEATRASDVVIYAVGIGGADRSVLKALTRETGGRAFFAQGTKELGSVYQRIADELRNQYVLVYRSTNENYDGKFRKIKLEHVGPGSYKVQTRQGYYAVRPDNRPLDAPPAPAPDPTDAPAEEGVSAEEAALPSAARSDLASPSPPGSPGVAPAPAAPGRR